MPPGTPRPKYIVLDPEAGTISSVFAGVAPSSLALANGTPLLDAHVVLLTPKCAGPIQLPPYTSMYAFALPVLSSVTALVVAMLLPALSLPKFIADGLSEIVHVCATDEKVMAAVLPATRLPLDGLGT